MRIALIADSHLAERAPACVHNWVAAAAAVARLGVDLTVHLGDISLDGQSRPEELGFAAALMARWPTPIRCVPGNHDMGDGSGEAPLDAAQLAACEAIFGPGHWLLTAGHWALIGINAQLLGTGTPQEQAQWEWLEAHANALPSEHSMLFLHRPLLRPSASEHDRLGRYVPHEAAQRLLNGPLRPTLRAVASGHTHQYLDLRRDGVRHLWLPSTAFVLPDTIQTRVGEKLVGLGVLELGGALLPSSVWFDLLCPDGMHRHVVGEQAFHGGR